MNIPKLSGLVRIALLCIVGGASSSGSAEGIRVVTEELPPFNMTKGGEVTGLSTEVVRAVLKEAGIGATIQSMPWARAYDLALNTPDVLIYSISRTPEREKLFKWVGVVAPTHWYLFSLSARAMRPQNLNGARSFQIGTVNEDVGEQYLEKNGFSVGKNLQSSNEHKLIYEKLKLARVDFWISDEVSAYHLVRNAGDDPAKVLDKSLALTELEGSEGGMEMAFSVKTSDEIVQRVRKAFATIQSQGTYATILKGWL